MVPAPEGYNCQPHANSCAFRVLHYLLDHQRDCWCRFLLWVLDFLAVGRSREGGCSIRNGMALWGTGEQSGLPRLAPNGLGGIRSRSVALAEGLQTLFGIL